MISSTLGAPLGGTTVGGHHGLEFLASEVDHAAELRWRVRKILPSMVVVALGRARRAGDLLGRGRKAQPP